MELTAPIGLPVIPKFAYVRFLEDNVKTIVKIEDIKRFRPKDIEDFTEGKAYMVKWGDDNDEDEFYKAQILKLGGTMEEVKDQLSKSRVRFPVMYDTSVDATTEEEDDDAEVERLTLAKEKKEKRKQTSKATTSSLRSMLGQRLKEKEDAPLFSSTPKKKRTLDDSRDITANQEGVLQQKLPNLRKQLEASVAEAEKLRRKLGDCRKEANEYKELNKRLQAALLDKFETEGPQSSSESPKRAKVSLTPVYSSSQKSEGTSAMEKKDGKVNIGANVWLPEDKWEAICSQQKHSMFVKTLLVAIWGTNTLKGKSLEGKACPRFKGDRNAKPPLSPVKVNAMKARFMQRLKENCLDSQQFTEEAAKFRKYISEKLQDINRTTKKA